MNKRHYEIILYYEENNTVDESIKNEWNTSLQRIGETLDLDITLNAENEKQICFYVMVPEAIDLNKALRSVQKKLKKYTAYIRR